MFWYSNFVMTGRFKHVLKLNVVYRSNLFLKVSTFPERWYKSKRYKIQYTVRTIDIKILNS